MITKKQEEKFSKIVDFLIKYNDIDKLLDVIPDKVKIDFLNIFLNPVCPKCKSEQIVQNIGSTNITPIKHIYWICKDCLYEF